MISCLKIKNFKSHRDTTIRFTSGFNAIVGSPQSGKTNIVRSLMLLSKNRPLGAGFLPDFMPDGCMTMVEVGTTEGSVSRVEKDLSVDKDGEPCVEATRFSVDGGEPFSRLPDVLQSALNLSDINVQKQMDSPFLAVSTGGEVARYINKITKLDKSTEWISEASKMVRGYDASIKDLSSSIKGTKEQLSSFEGIDEAVGIMAQIDELEAQELECTRYLDELSAVFLSYTGIVNILPHRESIEAVKLVVAEIEDLGDQIVWLGIEKDLIDQLIKVNLEWKTIEPVLSSITNMCEEASSVDAELGSLDIEQHAIDSVLLARKAAEVAAVARRVARDKFIQVLERLAVCPLCISELGEEQMVIVKDKI